MESKDLWDLESAMKVLAHDSVDSKIWAEAVEWLMLYGPPEIRQLLADASKTATANSFPNLKPSHLTEDGEVYYDIKDLADSLSIKESEAREILKKKEQEHDQQSLFDQEGNKTVH